MHVLKLESAERCYPSSILLTAQLWKDAVGTQLPRDSAQYH